MSTCHVAFVKAEHLAGIISGSKRVESRLSITLSPAWAVEAGDTILFKRSGGEIECQARAVTVHKFESLRPVDITALFEMFAHLMSKSDQRYWQQKSKARYAVIIELDRVEAISFPPQHTPRFIMAGWVSNFQNGELALSIDQAQGVLF